MVLGKRIGTVIETAGFVDGDRIHSYVVGTKKVINPDLWNEMSQL